MSYFECMENLRQFFSTEEICMDEARLSIVSSGAAVQPVFNRFSQFVPQLERYSQLQLNLLSHPMLIVMIQGDGNLAETQMKK